MVLKITALPPALVTPSARTAREAVDVDVAGRHLAPRRADADLGFGEVVAGEADRVQHGAARGSFGTVEDF